MRILTLLCLMLAFVLPARLAYAQAKTERLTIAAYNVEFMLDVFDDPYSKDEEHPPKTRKDIEQIARAIRAINPDVITLEEVENEGVVRAMVHEFLGDLGYEYIAADTTNSDRGQNLGIISRRPIVSLTSHRFLPLKLEGQAKTWHFGRDLWKVRIQATPSQTVDLFVVHLKSKLESVDDPNSAHWRQAEVTAARKIIGQELAANPNEMAVMLGDFNDTPESPAIQELLRPQEDRSPFLVDVHAGLPASRRITFLHPPHRSTIDYLLVSPAMAKHLVSESPRVLSDETLLSGSDHAPISASFDLED